MIDTVIYMLGAGALFIIAFLILSAIFVAIWGTFFWIMEKTYKLFGWVPMAFIPNERKERQTQLMLLIPITKYLAVCMVRETKKRKGRS